LVNRVSNYQFDLHNLSLLTSKQFRQGSRQLAELGRLLGGRLKKQPVKPTHHAADNTIK